MNLMVFLLIFVLLALVIVIKDFNKTKGYLLQKKLHVLGICLLYVLNITSFKYLYRFFANFQDLYRETESTITWIFPEIYFIFIFISNILGVVLFIFIFSLMKRRDSARKIILKLIPWAVFTSIPSLIALYIKQSDELGRVLALMMSVFFVVAYFGLYRIYNNSNMKKFFWQPKGYIPTNQD